MHSYAAPDSRVGEFFRLKADKLFENCDKYIKESLPTSIYWHTQGAVATAIKLTMMFNIDSNKAALAALLHDNAKWMKEEEMIQFAQKNNIKPAIQDQVNINTLHGPVGAFIAKTKLGVKDPDVLEAITHHTFVKPEMCDLAKLVLLADKIDPVTRDKDLIKSAMQTLTRTRSLNEGIVTLFKERHWIP